jgi:hypothetical protein
MGKQDSIARGLADILAKQWATTEEDERLLPWGTGGELARRAVRGRLARTVRRIGEMLKARESAFDLDQFYAFIFKAHTGIDTIIRHEQDACNAMKE